MPLTLSFHGPDRSRLGKLGSAKLESRLAIVGSPERTSMAARRIGGTGNGFRIEVFSDRAGPGEKAGQAETDIDRLTTLVSSGHIGRGANDRKAASLTSRTVDRGGNAGAIAMESR